MSSRLHTARHRRTAIHRRHADPALADAIDYRDPRTLQPFISARGRIKGRSQTGLSRRDQSHLARAVKRARELALLPYLSEGGPARPARERR